MKKILTSNGKILTENGKILTANVESESVNVVKGGGTVVPNTGFLEGVYINYNASVDEVLELIANIEYPINVESESSVGKKYYVTYVNEDNNIQIDYIKNAEFNVDGYIIMGLIAGTVFVLFASNESIQKLYPNNIGNVGWNANYVNNPYTALETEVFDVTTDGTSVGLDNDKLINLISTTPFESKVIKELSGDYKVVDIVVTENKTVDVETYLDNKQMPISVTVNVEPNLQEKEITENGEYVADEGYDGFSKITVNVAGEDMLQARVDATNSCEYLFYRYIGNNVDFIKDLDTSKVTNMSSMFRDCSALETIPQLDMIKVSSASQMFNNCSKLTNLTLLNIKPNLDLSQSEKLTLESLINTVKEFINVGSARILTMGTANLEKIASTYVKFTDSSVTSIPTNEKGDVVVCESTDEGAMLLKDYALLKNRTLA